MKIKTETTHVHHSRAPCEHLALSALRLPAAPLGRPLSDRLHRAHTFPNMSRNRRARTAIVLARSVSGLRAHEHPARAARCLRAHEHPARAARSHSHLRMRLTLPSHSLRPMPRSASMVLRFVLAGRDSTTSSRFQWGKAFPHRRRDHAAAGLQIRLCVRCARD